MESVVRRAAELDVPIVAHLDLTYRCNERCIHCYLPHDSRVEMATDEVARVLQQLAQAGTLFLILSGGEIFLRPDLFEIIELARRLNFCVTLKTNATLITPEIAGRLRALGIHGVDVSIYARNPAVHDGITRMAGSLQKSLDAIRAMHGCGIRVRIANVLMRENAAEAVGVLELAKELGVPYLLDPTVTPMIDGDVSVLRHRAEKSAIQSAFADFNLGDCPAEDFKPAASDGANDILCSAGHSLVYINDRGQVFPCVQFPIECGDLRKQTFAELWKSSPEFVQVRAVGLRDLPVCSACKHSSYCTRCPGLAWMEGDLRGPSSADCEKAEARSGRH